MRRCRYCKRETDSTLDERRRVICASCGACKCFHCRLEANRERIKEEQANEISELEEGE